MNNETMTYKEWLVTLMLLMIPLVNIVLMIIWALDKNGNETRANFCKAQLTIALIVVVLGVIFNIALIGLFANIL